MKQFEVTPGESEASLFWDVTQKYIGKKLPEVRKGLGSLLPPIKQELNSNPDYLQSIINS